MTDWGAINAGPTPSLDEYRALEKTDSNAFWRLDSGHHQNLLDAALEEIERLRTALDEVFSGGAVQVPSGWELVRIPEVDDILEEEDPQCSCTHPHHHTGRCANEADNGGMCLPCIHGCSP